MTVCSHMAQAELPMAGRPVKQLGHATYGRDIGTYSVLSTGKLSWQTPKADYQLRCCRPPSELNRSTGHPLPQHIAGITAYAVCASTCSMRPQGRTCGSNRLYTCDSMLWNVSQHKSCQLCAVVLHNSTAAVAACSQQLVLQSSLQPS